MSKYTTLTWELLCSLNTLKQMGMGGSSAPSCVNSLGPEFYQDEYLSVFSPSFRRTPNRDFCLLWELSDVKLDHQIAWVEKHLEGWKNTFVCLRGLSEMSTS